MRRKRWLCLLFTLAALIPVYLFGGFMYIQNEGSRERLLTENMEAAKGAQIFDLRKFCEDRKKEMEVLSRLDMIHDAVYDKTRGKQLKEQQQRYLQNMLEERKAYSDNIQSITIVNRDLWTVASSEEYDDSVKSGLQGVREERCLTGDFYISGIKTRRSGSEDIQVLVAYQGIWDGDELIGYVVEEINPDYFDRNRKEMSLWDNSTLYILDANNRVITAGEVDGEKRNEFVTSEEERENYTREWAKIDFEKTPSGSIQYNINDTNYITYYSSVEYTDWKILLSSELDVYQTSQCTYWRALLGALGLVSVILLVMNLLMIHYCTSCNVGTCDEGNSLDEGRRTLGERVSGILGDAARKGKRAAVGCVDIDDFRGINARYGVQNGEKVISFVSKVLENNISGVSGRKEGDKFIFVTDHVDGLEKKIQKIMHKLNEGFQNSEIEGVMSVSCSIGVVIAEGEALSYTYLVRRAEESVFHVKKHGKNNYHLIDLSDKGDESKV